MPRPDPVRELITSEAAKAYVFTGGNYDLDQVFQTTIESIGEHTRIMRGLLDRPELFMALLRAAEGPDNYSHWREEVENKIATLRQVDPQG